MTIRSNGSLVENNVVDSNGKQAVARGYTNISGLSVRRSNRVTAKSNKVLNNHVSADSPWAGQDLGHEADSNSAG